MGRIFYRQYPRAFWEPSEWEGPLKDISLREWEIAVILSPQHREIDHALRRWLETPTDHQRWPWSNKVPHLRALFAVGELSKPVDTLLDLFHDEIKTIRETLDFPIEVFSGPNRNALLAAHGQRLRWLVRRLGLKRALVEIAQLTAPAPQTTPSATEVAARGVPPVSARRWPQARSSDFSRRMFDWMNVSGLKKKAS